MALHDIHGRRLQIEQISHTDQSDGDVRIESDRVLRYDAERILTGLDLVYADWVFAILESLNYIEITGGGPLPSEPADGDVHIMDDGTIMQYDGDGWQNKGSIPTGQPTYTLDTTPNIDLAHLNSTYPNAKPGDQVYSTLGGTRRAWTCYAAGEWSRIDEVIET